MADLLGKSVLKIEIIKSLDDIKNKEIKNRAKLSSKTKNTNHYVAKKTGHEIGFLSIDIIENSEYLVFYEMFIPSSLRNLGYGNLLLSEVEKLAKDLNYKKVSINPNPLELNFSKNNLINWYKRRGYREQPTANGELYKQV